MSFKFEIKQANMISRIRMNEFLDLGNLMKSLSEADEVYG